MTYGHLNTQSLQKYSVVLSELFDLCGHVTVHEGDVTFWANSVRNNAKSLADSLKYLERELDKRELAQREQFEKEQFEREVAREAERKAEQEQYERELAEKEVA